MTLTCPGRSTFDTFGTRNRVGTGWAVRASKLEAWRRAKHFWPGQVRPRQGGRTRGCRRRFGSLGMHLRLCTPPAWGGTEAGQTIIADAARVVGTTRSNADTRGLGPPHRPDKRARTTPGPCYATTRSNEDPADRLNDLRKKRRRRRHWENHPAAAALQTATLVDKPDWADGEDGAGRKLSQRLPLTRKWTSCHVCRSWAKMG